MTRAADRLLIERRPDSLQSRNVHSFLRRVRTVFRSGPLGIVRGFSAFRATAHDPSRVGETVIFHEVETKGFSRKGLAAAEDPPQVVPDSEVQRYLGRRRRSKY